MNDLNLLGPQLALLIGAGVIIIVDVILPIVSREAYLGRRLLLSGLAILAAAGSAAWSLALVLADERGAAFDGMIAVDDFTLFFNFLFAGVAGVIVLASIDFLDRHRFQGEYLALILIAAAGMSLMAAGADLIMIFVALELQAIALFALVGISKSATGSEATLKFLLLSAVSTAITLYGMAYLFGLSGETSLGGIASYVANTDENRSALVLAAVFLTAGLGFKMAVVPFQMWVPDVYEGAPTPITAFLSVASKAAGFAVVMRIFLIALGEGIVTTDWAYLFAAIAAVSMTVGNVLALVQGNIKRMLGYSSIAQAGTILIGLAAVAAEDPQLLLGTSSVVFFLGAYAFTNIGVFIAIIAISHKIGSDQIDDYAGVAKRSPLLAFGLAACLFSLTGFPPTAGFIAKIYVFNAAVQADLVWLAIIGVLNSVIAAYYYLRVVLNMFTRDPETDEAFLPSPYLNAALAAAVIGVFAIGIYPTPLIEASEAAARVFS